MSEAKVAVALLAGLAAGAAIGILFAPESGSDTRDKLTESLTNLGESIKNSASEQIDNLVDTFKSKVVENIKEKFGHESKHDEADDLEHA